MTDFTVGPKYATSVISTNGQVYSQNFLFADDNNDGYIYFAPPDEYDSSVTLGGFGFNIPLDATIIGILVEIECYNNASTIASILVGMNMGGYKAISVSTTRLVRSWGSLSDPWSPPTRTPEDINNLQLTIAQAGFQTGFSFSMDYVRVTVKYSTPPQSISPAPVVMRLGSPAQSLTRGDPNDPTTYTNTLRAGELIKKSHVNRVRLSATQPSTNLEVGNVWLHPDGGIRIWNGAQWNYLAQPDSLLLASMMAGSVSESAWVTVAGADLGGVPNTWGFSWLITGLTSGADARIRLNSNDTYVWPLTGHETFGFYETENVWGAARLANASADNIQADAAFSMPSTLDTIELQLRRVSATQPNAITSFTLWGHPR